MSVNRGVSVLALAAALIVAGAALAAGTGTPQQFNRKASKEAPKTPPALTQEQMQANFAKAGTPGDPHKILENFAGSWTSHVRMQMDPNAPMQESDGTAEGRVIMGGRFVQVTHKGTVMGQPFEGLMVCGYDNIAAKYVASWFDNMTTEIVRYDGSYDKNTKKLMMGSRLMDPMTWKPTNLRTVTTFVSPTSWTYEEYAPAPGGKERLTMSITFTKRG